LLVCGHKVLQTHLPIIPRLEEVPSQHALELLIVWIITLIMSHSWKKDNIIYLDVQLVPLIIFPTIVKDPK
jgi:hypothetical protein